MVGVTVTVGIFLEAADTAMGVLVGMTAVRVIVQDGVGTTGVGVRAPIQRLNGSGWRRWNSAPQ